MQSPPLIPLFNRWSNAKLPPPSFFQSNATFYRRAANTKRIRRPRLPPRGVLERSVRKQLHASCPEGAKSGARQPFLCRRGRGGGHGESQLRGTEGNARALHRAGSNCFPLFCSGAGSLALAPNSPRSPPRACGLVHNSAYPSAVRVRDTRNSLKISERGNYFRETIFAWRAGNVVI